MEKQNAIKQAYSFDLRPASVEEAGLFYSDENQDAELGTVGHLRMDFGSGGKGFYHTWWPHNGDRFNTPEFIALADRARELGRALVQVERKPGTASLSLYINGGNVRYGPEDLYTNAFPMRLTADEPVRISAYGFLYIVRKGSPYAQICRELIAGLTCPEDGQPRRCMLFREVAQSQYGTPDFSYNPNGDVLTRNWQEQYRPEWLFFDVEPFFQARQVQRSEGAMYKFAGGSLTAEEFAATLDEILRES